MTLIFADNRAVPIDGLGHPSIFYPPQSNATVIPRLLAFDGAQTFPTPDSPAWSHMNRRRAELIRRKVRGGLSNHEERELEWLQRQTLAAVERAFPRPVVDLGAVAQLEERLKQGEMETPE